MEFDKIMSSIFHAIESSEKGEYGHFMEELSKKFNEGEELYETEAMLAFMTIQDLIAEPFKKKYQIKETDQRKLAVIPCIYNGMLESFLTKKIEKEEGGVFSGDKASYAISMIKKALVSGKNIMMEIHYEDFPDMYKGKSGKCYWCPSSFKDTDDAIEQFMSWYCMDNI